MSDDVVKASEVKRIPIKEFRALGFVQEINRRVLHPCGLALEVIVDEETGEESFGGIWDYREDPEGLIFADGVLSMEKADHVAQSISVHEAIRRERFGWVVQPVPKEEE